MSHRHDKDRVVLALLALVRARHSVSRAELMDQFGPGTDHNLKNKQVFYVLDRMKRDQQLACTGGTQSRRWVLHPLQRAGAPAPDPLPPAPDPLPPAPPLPLPPAPPPPPPLVPSRNYDLMRAPLYVPAPGLVLRPGAQDFARYPSVGTRC